MWSNNASMDKMKWHTCTQTEGLMDKITPMWHFALLVQKSVPLSRKGLMNKQLSNRSKVFIKTIKGATFKAFMWKCDHYLLHVCFTDTGDTKNNHIGFASIFSLENWCVDNQWKIWKRKAKSLSDFHTKISCFMTKQDTTYSLSDVLFFYYAGKHLPAQFNEVIRQWIYLHWSWDTYECLTNSHVIQTQTHT